MILLFTEAQESQQLLEQRLDFLYEERKIRPREADFSRGPRTQEPRSHIKKRDTARLPKRGTYPAGYGRVRTTLSLQLHRRATRVNEYQPPLGNPLLRTAPRDEIDLQENASIRPR